MYLPKGSDGCASACDRGVADNPEHLWRRAGGEPGAGGGGVSAYAAGHSAGGHCVFHLARDADLDARVGDAGAGDVRVRRPAG